MDLTCTLCGEKGSHSLQDGLHRFCCFGCRTVWHLLSSRGALENYREHPVFIQAVQSGLISNPFLKVEPQEAEERKRVPFEVSEMWCPSCAEVIELLVKMEKGVLSCKVDYTTDLAMVEYDPRKISSEEIFKFISQLGYHPTSIENILNKKVDRSLYIKFFVASFAALNVMMFSYPLYATYFNYEIEGFGPLLGWLSFGFSLPVMFYCASGIWSRFYHSLRTGLYGMESLVIIGILSSFMLSVVNLLKGNTEVYFDTLTVIVTFILLGKIIESKAKLSAKESFYQLSRSLPQRARREGIFVSLKEISAGDLIEVVAGERVPLDGEITQGEALFNEASRTGESIPILKQTGDKVESGGIVVTGRLFVKVAGGDSALKKMVEACLINLDHKSKYVRALDPIVRAFVPFVLLLAALVYFFTGSFENTLATLLISCPCAIGIAAPLVEARWIHIYAHLGAIVRNRGALFSLSQATQWVFDKTGTLTYGNLKIEGLEKLNQFQQSALKGLASLSRHPVSLSCALALDEVEARLFSQVYETEGGGIKGDNYLLGSANYLRSHFVEVPLEDDQQSEVWFWDGSEAHSLKLHDTVRTDAKESLQDFPATFLLSGDKESIVARLCQQLNIKNWRSQVTPLGKKEVIKELKEKSKVVFVGDGLNDAPALTEADVGIAVVSSSGLAEAASDILLTTSSLSILSQLYEVALLGKKLIYQNLFWAFIYNLVGLVLATLGLLTPLFAAFAMTASSLIVILNSMRLRTPKI